MGTLACGPSRNRTAIDRPFVHDSDCEVRCVSSLRAKRRFEAHLTRKVASVNKSVFVPPDFSASKIWFNLLEQWLKMLRRYEDENSDSFDNAYWYGERPLTGLLGAAAWQLGGWSLEEFGTDRHKKRGGPKTSSGRGDLWLALGELRATIEAKIHWPDKTKTDAKHELFTCLKEAKSQLREMPAESLTDHSFAVCYVVPWYRNSDATRDKGKKVLEYLREMAQTKGNLATAVHFGSTADGGDKRLYPGVLLVAKEVRIPKKN